MSTGACVGMASQAEEKCDTSLTVWLFSPPVHYNGEERFGWK